MRQSSIATQNDVVMKLNHNVMPAKNAAEAKE